MSVDTGAPRHQDARLLDGPAERLGIVSDAQVADHVDKRPSSTSVKCLTSPKSRKVTRPLPWNR